MRRALPLLAAYLLVGCAAQRDRVVSGKSTVFGMEFTTLDGGWPRLRLGLVRYSWFSVPVSTNALHTVPFVSHVDAKLPLGSTADERFGVGTTNLPAQRPP